MPSGFRAFRLRPEGNRREPKVARLPPGKGVAVVMSSRELERAEAILLLDYGLVSRAEASELMEISRSQTYKLLGEYRVSGAAALVRKARGRPSNRAFPAEVRAKVLELIEENYHDYGPTLLAEVLLEDHEIRISSETLRQWMIEAGLWLKNRSARKRLHQPRPRMPFYGDMVQIDGSDHNWFEDRGPRCTAMVMVDDATGRIQNLMFVPRENRDAYFSSVESYTLAHGRPIRIVTDRHSAVWSKHRQTEFTRALQKLTIVHSYAYSAQSKGRVERIHRTLQDRLVKDMRRKGISTIEEANAYVPRYLKKFNRKFGKSPSKRGNNHRPIEKSELDRALAVQYLRKVTRNLTFSWGGVEYLIESPPKGQEPIGPKVVVEVQLNGAMEVFAGIRRLTVRRFPE